MTLDRQPHIQLSSEVDVDYALLPGDPKRVDRVKNFLNDVQEITYNREYKSVIGYYKGIKVLILSTGIGSPSMGIAIEELKRVGVKCLIRIGSSGSLQPEVKLGDLIIATGAVRNEGTSDSYIEKGYPAFADIELVHHIKHAAEREKHPHHMGVIRSHDSFYTDKEEEIYEYWSKRGVIGSDMETSSLFVIGRLRGMQTASILNVVVPCAGGLEAGINQFVDGDSITFEGEKKQIIVALEAIVSFHKNKTKGEA
ncbi:nucleoside phosphorylase [Heyndrickxia camelliae]|uniref:Uridine phosphorylase n=1 Tax=Heyndrickxia camelliae TaxID=1707093 RepID=A0A2N3LNY1_9BACI|nr:nucleoside phosphorylase [Heyndrickxia camelliae]PKR86326.1 uridine phosphorylase [Heyndrickxia camelliae]